MVTTLAERAQSAGHVEFMLEARLTEAGGEVAPIPIAVLDRLAGR